MWYLEKRKARCKRSVSRINSSLSQWKRSMLCVCSCKSLYMMKGMRSLRWRNSTSTRTHLRHHPKPRLWYCSKCWSVDWARICAELLHCLMMKGMRLSRRRKPPRWCMRVKRRVISWSCIGWALCLRRSQLIWCIKKFMRQRGKMVTLLSIWKVPLKSIISHGFTNSVLQSCFSTLSLFLSQIYVRHKLFKVLVNPSSRSLRLTLWLLNQWLNKRLMVI